MSCVKEGCKKAFQAQPQRLMAAMYSCNIQVTAEALGESALYFHGGVGVPRVCLLK